MTVLSPAARAWNGSFLGWTVLIGNQTGDSPCLGTAVVSRASFDPRTGALEDDLNSSVSNPASCIAGTPTTGTAATIFTLTSPVFRAAANCLCVARANWNLDWRMSTYGHVDNDPRLQSTEGRAAASGSVSVFDLTTNAFWPDGGGFGWLNNYSGVENQNGSTFYSWDRYLSLPTIVALSSGDRYVVVVTLEFEAQSQANWVGSNSPTYGSGNAASANVTVLGGPTGSRLLSVTVQ